MNGPLLPGLPLKPREGEPCNGCGWCCAMEVCGVGKKLDPTAVAPCPFIALETDTTTGAQRIRCGVVLLEQSHGLAPIVQAALGIGRGCDAED